MNDMSGKEINQLLSELLVAVNEQPSPLVDRPLLKAPTWHSVGVDMPYCIFFTGRCGSTWLTSLVKETKLAGNPDEFLNGNIARYYSSKVMSTAAQGLAHYFTSVVERETSNRRFGLEIDAERLMAISDVVDIASLFPQGRSAVFFMYRRDIVAQAYSWAAARKSGLWHVKVSEEGKSMSSSSEQIPTISDLILEIIRIRRDEEFLMEFFASNGFNPIYIEYEALVADTMATLCWMLVNLAVPVEKINGLKQMGGGKIKPLVYEEKYSVLVEMYTKFNNALLLLSKNRFGISAKELESYFAGA